MNEIEKFSEATIDDRNSSLWSKQEHEPHSGGSRISQRWERQPSGEGGGAPTYDFAKFSQKLNEIERIWTRGGASLAPPLDPPLPHERKTHEI